MKLTSITAAAVVASALAFGCKGSHHDHDGHDHHGHSHHSEAKEVEIAEKDVPAPVMAGFRKAFADAKIEEVNKETYADGTVHYEFEFKDKSGKEHEVEFSATGEQLDDH